jgi:hypothetical protein
MLTYSTSCTYLLYPFRAFLLSRDTLRKPYAKLTNDRTDDCAAKCPVLFMGQEQG